jgi:lactaldehyde dehydrogenase/glycolaldehyde dehydrogenase
MGVVACLIPFNYPVYTLLRKIAPALITGNAVLVRPSNNTPTSALEIARCVQDSGFPSDLIQIMVMSHASAQRMCTHPKVAMMTLTGSVQAGQKVIGYSRANIAKVSLELGGKTPVIVEPDADLDAVALAIVNAKLTHCGQLCTAPERVYAHTSIHDSLVEKMHAAVLTKTHGDRATNANFVGPLVSAFARANIHAMVQRAVAAGAHLLCGGAIPEGPGFFYPPTLLTHCEQHSEIVQEELFGPVLPVLRYAHLDQALEWANDHQFGLSSVLFTSDLRKAMHVANGIESGELYINRMPADPYQGYHAGWKRSGLGGDDGKHGMLEFTQTRLVVMKY